MLTKDLAKIVVNFYQECINKEHFVSSLNDRYKEINAELLWEVIDLAWEQGLLSADSYINWTKQNKESKDGGNSSAA